VRQRWLLACATEGRRGVVAQAGLRPGRGGGLGSGRRVCARVVCGLRPGALRSWCLLELSWTGALGWRVNRRLCPRQSNRTRLSQRMVT